jgi:hypothetical protein
MRTRTAIVSFVLGLLSFTSLSAAAEVLEGEGAPDSILACETPTEVLPKEILPEKSTPSSRPGGFIEGTE